MITRRTPIARILSLRPLRPPNANKPRPFTQNSALLLLAPQTPRPQLPYLSQPAFRRPAPLNGPSQQLARLLSTETKLYLKEQAWLATKYTAIIWTFIGLGVIVYIGYRMEMDERTNPTPVEWRFVTRNALRAGRAQKSERWVREEGFTDWAKVGSSFRLVLALLEDVTGEGKGLEEVGGDGEEILIPDVGRAGFDISAKSWPWRAGYFEACMGCAMAAEHLDTHVLDQTRSMVFPRDVVIGPSNPDPRPTPPYMASAPLEENCTTAFAAPETYYMRVLTGKGFTTKQRLDAALAYANWLQYKGLPESAEEMYKWGIDIAKGALPLGTNVDAIVDSKTHVLKVTPDETDPAVTPNILRAVTDMATHHARTGNLSAALPIFLSVLRARRSAPVSPFPELASDAESRSLWSKVLSPTPFPPPPPSGDTPLVRGSSEASCEESELMLYIGEILFASAASSAAAAEEGLGWTRQAVAIADAHLKNHPHDTGVGIAAAEAKRKCKECFVTGVGNWDVMLKRVVAQQAEPQTVSSRGWFSWAGQASAVTGMGSERVAERRRVDALRDRMVREGIAEQVEMGRNSNPSGVWIG